MSEAQQKNIETPNTSPSGGGVFNEIDNTLKSFEQSNNKLDIQQMSDLIDKINYTKNLVKYSPSDKARVDGFIEKTINVISNYLKSLEAKKDNLSAEEINNIAYLEEIATSLSNLSTEKEEIQTGIKDKIKELNQEVQNYSYTPAGTVLPIPKEGTEFVTEGNISSNIEIEEDSVTLYTEGKRIKLTEGAGLKLDPDGNFFSGGEDWTYAHDFTITNFKRDISKLEEGQEIELYHSSSKRKINKVVTLKKYKGEIQIIDTGRYFKENAEDISILPESVKLSEATSIANIITDPVLQKSVNVALDYKKDEKFLEVVHSIDGFEKYNSLNEVLNAIQKEPKLAKDFNDGLKDVSNTLLIPGENKKISLLDYLLGHEEQIKEAIKEYKKINEAAEESAKQIAERANLNKTNEQKIKEYLTENWTKVKAQDDSVIKNLDLTFVAGDYSGIGVSKSVLTLENKEGFSFDLAIVAGYIDGHFGTTPISTLGYKFTEKASGRIMASLYGVGIEGTIGVGEYKKASGGLYTLWGGVFSGIVVEGSRDSNQKAKDILSGKKTVKNIKLNGSELVDFELTEEVEDLSPDLYDSINSSKADIIKFLNKMIKLNNLSTEEEIKNMIIGYFIGKIGDSNEFSGWHWDSISGGIGVGIIPVIIGAGFTKLNKSESISKDEAFVGGYNLAKGKDSNELLYAKGNQYIDFDEIQNTVRAKYGSNSEVSIWKKESVNCSIKDGKVYITTENVRIKEVISMEGNKVRVMYMLYPTGFDLKSLAGGKLNNDYVLSERKVGNKFDNISPDELITEDTDAALNIEKQYEEIKKELKGDFDNVFTNDLKRKVAKFKYEGIWKRNTKMFETFDKNNLKVAGDEALKYMFFRYFENFNSNESTHVDYQKMYDLVSRLQIFEGITNKIATIKDESKKAKAKLLFINKVGDLFLNVEEIQRAKENKPMYKTLDIVDLNVKANRPIVLENGYEIAKKAGINVKGKERLQELDFTRIKDPHIRYLLTREIFKVPPMNNSRFLGAIEKFNNLGLNWRGSNSEDLKGYIDLVMNIGENQTHNNILGFTVADHVSLDENAKGLMPILGSGEFVSVNKINLNKEDKKALLKNLDNKGIFNTIKKAFTEVLAESYQVDQNKASEIAEKLMTEGEYKAENVNLELTGEYYEGLMGVSSSISMFMKNPSIKGYIGQRSLNVIIDSSAAAQSVTSYSSIVSDTLGVRAGAGSNSLRDSINSAVGSGNNVSGNQGSGIKPINK